MPLALVELMESMADRMERMESAMSELADIGRSEQLRRRKAIADDEREAREQGEGPEIDRDLF